MVKKDNDPFLLIHLLSWGARKQSFLFLLKMSSSLSKNFERNLLMGLVRIKLIACALELEKPETHLEGKIKKFFIDFPN